MEVKVINKSENQLPRYETSKSAGCDARASFSNLQLKDFKRMGTVICRMGEDGNKITSVVLYPNSWCLVPTDLCVSIPEGYEIQVRNRSGQALKKGLIVMNGIGTIDADYRGNIGVIIGNFGEENQIIEEGERICQFILNKVEQIDWKETTCLDETDRGDGGFGHSGVK